MRMCLPFLDFGGSAGGGGSYSAGNAHLLHEYEVDVTIDGISFTLSVEALASDDARYVAENQARLSADVDADIRVGHVSQVR
jgi:hypothetical protein